MASFINTNMASLNTQRNLSSSQAALNTSIQRLSSGMRVNGAKDDAAGMAIASRMDSVIKGQTVAMRNANDAISFSQTAEGALGKIGDNLQRMRELAVQAANGTNGSEDRSSLDTEFKQLQSEITRVGSNTKFNGTLVLSGDSQNFQIGAGTSASDTITIKSASITSDSSETSKAAATGDGSALNQAKAEAAKLAGTPVKAFDAATGKLTITGATNTEEATAVAEKYNNALKEMGAGTTLTDITYDTTSGEATVGTNATAASHTAAEKVNNALAATTGNSILTETSAKASIEQIDKALKEVNTESIKHGANQNRFAAVIGTLQVSVENQTAARSRIMDTDFASETATMARGQILQQAGMAMLAQANQLPNGVMGLLR